MLEPVTRAFSRDVTEALVDLRASATAQSRIAELAEKCNEGTLTTAEQAEYETYVHTLDLISVLQAKAKAWLIQQSGERVDEYLGLIAQHYELAGDVTRDHLFDERVRKRYFGTLKG